MPILYLSRSTSSSDLSSQYSSSEAGDNNDNKNDNNWNMHNYWTSACGQEPKTRRPRTLTACSTTEADRVHYTKAETNKLFGGPLSLLYRARCFRAFADAFVVFERIFGSAVFPTRSKNNTSAVEPSCSTPTRNSSALTTKTHQQPSNNNTSTNNIPRSSAWTGSIESFADGTTVYTTTRILNGRRLIKTETLSVDPLTGQKHSKITVTGEDLDDEYDDDDERSQFSYYETDPGNSAYDWTCCSPALAFPSLAENSSSMDFFYRMNCMVW